MMPHLLQPRPRQQLPQGLNGPALLFKLETLSKSSFHNKKLGVRAQAIERLDWRLSSGLALWYFFLYIGTFLVVLMLFVCFFSFLFFLFGFTKMIFSLSQCFLRFFMSGDISSCGGLVGCFGTKKTGLLLIERTKKGRGRGFKLLYSRAWGSGAVRLFGSLMIQKFFLFSFSLRSLNSLMGHFLCFLLLANVWEGDRFLFKFYMHCFFCSHFLSKNCYLAYLELFLLARFLLGGGGSILVHTLINFESSQFFDL